MSVCSSQYTGDFYHQQDDVALEIDFSKTRETLRAIVASASQLQGCLSISSSGVRPQALLSNLPDVLSRNDLVRSGAAARPLPLTVGSSTVMPKDHYLASPPLSPRVSWQHTWHAAAGTKAALQQQQQNVADIKAAGTRPPARRCLCLSLDDLTPAPQQVGPEPPYTPAIGSAAKAATAMPAPTVRPGSCASCTHSSNSSRSRLQEWLGKMELQLQVPPTPVVPLEAPCPAPRNSSSAAGFDGRKRALAAVGALSLASPVFERSSKRRSSCDGSAAQPAAAAAEEEQHTIVCSSKATAAATAGPAAEIAAVVAAADGARPQCDSTAAADSSNVDGTASPAASAAWRDNGLPPPAFVILGVLSCGDSISD